jgi:hypothetical protein
MKRKNPEQTKSEYDRTVLNKDIPLEPEVAEELKILFKNELNNKRHVRQDAMSYRLPGSIGTGKRR